MSEIKINVERDINIHLENKSVSRLFFVFIMMMYSFVYMTKNCFSGALADIVTDGVMTKSQTGLIIAMFYLVYTPLQILGGIVADKYSPELMVKIGLIGGAAANAIIFFNHNYYVMLITWTANAIIQFALWPSTYKIISSQLCRSDRTYMLFFISLASSLGLLMTYVVAAVLPSWEYNFLLSGIVLLTLAVTMHFCDIRISKFMKPDAPKNSDDKKSVRTYNGSTFSMFWKSGFILLLLIPFVITVVGQGIKTLSPIMLVESFDISPSKGNLINTLIIIAGICGTLLVKLVLYPRFIKNEVVGMLVMLTIASVFAALLLFVPGLITTVLVLALTATVTTAPGLFVSYFNTNFTIYGKNGTAAGISNAASSLGVVVCSYVIVKIAEASSWYTVKVVWLVMLALSILTILVTLPMSNRFKRLSKSDETEK